MTDQGVLESMLLDRSAYNEVINDVFGGAFVRNEEIYPLPSYIVSPKPIETCAVRKPNYKKYLMSPEWKRTAQRARRRAGNKCQLCESQKNLNVHHNNYRDLGSEKSQDLIVLCEECHSKFHGVLPKHSPASYSGSFGGYYFYFKAEAGEYLGIEPNFAFSPVLNELRIRRLDGLLFSYPGNLKYKIFEKDGRTVIAEGYTGDFQELRKRLETLRFVSGIPGL